jgi:hypothetical protein
MPENEIGRLRDLLSGPYLSMQERKTPPPTHPVSTFDRALTIVSDEALVNFKFDPEDA